MELTSVTDYLKIEKTYSEDGDSSPFPFFVFQTSQVLDQVSQELRLSGSGDKLRWQAGFYYLNIDTDVGSSYDLDLFTFGEGTDFGQVINTGGHSSNLDTDSWAVFAQTDFDLSDTLTATLGLRYSNDEREIDYLGFDNFYDEVVTREKINFDNYSYKAQLDWRASEDTLVYAGVTRGHKAGNFQLGVGFPNLVEPHDEEVLSSLEVGFKAQLMDGLMRLNASAYYYDYEDYQAFVVDPTGNIATLSLVNVDAESRGAEIELTLAPTTGLDLLLGAAWIDSEVMDVGYPDGSVQDSELPYAPEFSFNGLIRYQWNIGASAIAAQADFNYVEDFCFSVLCAPLDEEDSYLVANARLKYISPNENWSVTAYVTNFTEEEYRLYSIDLSGLGLAGDAFGNPRMYGLTLDIKF